MKFKTLMIIKALVCLGFAPLLLFFPGRCSTCWAPFCTGAAFTAREYGRPGGQPPADLAARNAEPGFVRRAICWNLFAYDASAWSHVIFLLAGT